MVILSPALCRQVEGPVKRGNRSVVVPPNHLVAAADPEQRFGLTAHVADRLVQMHGLLEQRQLTRIFAGLFRVVVPLLKEAAVNEAAAGQGQGQVGFDRVKFPIGCRQRAAVAVKKGPFVEQPGPFDSFIRIHHRAYLRSETPPLDGGCRTTAEKPKLPGHPESAPLKPTPDHPPRARHESQ
jgi:hypothetical protein